MINSIFSLGVGSTDLNYMTYLRRAHVHSLLERCIQTPLTIIVAGAGYGKTRAVSSFLEECDVWVVWQQLTALDNNGTRHWEDFIHTIKPYNETFAINLDRHGFPESTSKLDTFISLLSDSLNPDIKYVLVYDDFHLIVEKKVLRLFEKLANACIPNLSIILMSRKEPEINTAALLSKGLLSSIHEEDFRFSESEMLEYFQLQGIKQSSGALSKIYNHTDGWIFAIYLIGLSLKKGVSCEENALSAMKVKVFDLIESEIFSVASDELKIFLVKLSLFDNWRLELLRELSSGNGKLLNDMATISAFIRYDTFLNAYCIHHLFLEFLNGKQDLLTEQEKRECYQKVADWYAKNGYKISAIIYYEKAKVYNKMFAMIAPYPTTVSEELGVFFTEVLERASKDMGENNSFAIILHARFLGNGHKSPKAYAELSDLRKKHEALPSSPENALFLCQIYLVLGFVCLYNRTLEFKRFFKMAYDTGSKMVYKHDFSIGNYACEVGTPTPGKIDRFIGALIYSIPYVMEVMHGVGYGYDDLAIAELAFFRRDLKSAERYAYQAIAKAQQNKQIHIENMATFYSIRINMALGNYTKISDFVGKLKLQSEIQNVSGYYTMYELATKWFYSLIEQMEEVSPWDKNDFKASKTTLTNTSGLYQLATARSYFAQRKYIDVLTLLKGLENEKIARNFLFGKIEVNVLKAVSLYHINEKDEAIKVLQEAYSFAAPNSLIMPFVELGNDMLVLIKAALKTKSRTIPHEWLENIQRKSSAYAKKLSFIISEDKKSHNRLLDDPRLKLTHKELECLNDLCQGLTMAEIAAQYDLSISAVRNRMENIYSKLGAKNTRDAIRIATSLNLLQ